MLVVPSMAYPTWCIAFLSKQFGKIENEHTTRDCSTTLTNFQLFEQSQTFRNHTYEPSPGCSELIVPVTFIHEKSDICVAVELGGN